mgnify:CR=1 FL=1
MGRLRRIENKLERAINGAFAKAFRAEVQPVEIASAVRRAMDDGATSLAKGRTFVPAHYRVELSETDYERLTEYEEELTEELLAAAEEHAESEQYQTKAPLAMRFARDSELETGVFRITSEDDAGTRRSTSGRASGRRGVGDVPDERARPGAAEFAEPDEFAEADEFAEPVGSPAPSRPGMSPRPTSGGGAPGNAPAQPAAPPRAWEAADDWREGSYADGTHDDRAYVDAAQVDGAYQPDSVELDDRILRATRQPVNPVDDPNGPSDRRDRRGQGEHRAPARRESPPHPPARSVAPADRPWLEIDGDRFPLLGPVTVLGRDISCAIVVEDANVSRRHCEVRVTHDGPHLIARLRDLGSTNGTWVDGERIDSRRLGTGDRVTIGATDMIFHARGR